MKKGLIKISNILYQESWADIHIIFRDFKPIHIEYRHWENDTWYFYGTCDKFDELSEAQIVPEYSVIFTRENGCLNYKFERL